VLFVSGFVVYEILSEWPTSKTILTWLPNHINSTLAITGQAAGCSSAAIMFLMFPAALLLVVITVAKLRSPASVGTIVATFALLLLPTLASAHLIKAMFKTTSRIPYWPGARYFGTEGTLPRGKLRISWIAPDCLGRDGANLPQISRAK